MESFYSRYRNVLVLVAVLLAQVIGLAVQVRRPAAASGHDGPQVRVIRYWVSSFLSPFEEIFLFTGHGIRGVWNGYLDLRHVRQNNHQLQAEIDRLRIEQSSLAEDARQGQRLQKLLGFQQQYIYQTVAAQVIGTSGTDQSRVIYINRGASDGIKADMPVITPDGVVGKIRNVFSHTSQVLEIDDQTSGLGVILQKTRLRGILRGNATGQPEVVNILPDERILSGESVITSGGDQVYPRGLPVGTVDRVVNDPDRAPYVAVLVQPAARLSRLEEVLVVTQMGTALPATEEADIITSEQKAADVLAQRLPGADSNLPALGPNGKPLPPENPNAPPPPTQVPPALHPDRFTPGVAPPAAALKPGASYARQHFAAPTQTFTAPQSFAAPQTFAAPSMTAPANTAPSPAKKSSRTKKPVVATPATPAAAGPSPATTQAAPASAKPAAPNPAVPNPAVQEPKP